ncbi:MAG: Txe/YoeB family addiction module toxin [Treponema sp.]|jgi:toxin YoeB|nr:Txe/YoeB family addiction module toxin [Treponema sp.]
MQKLWTDEAWDDYLYWQTNDKKTLKRINQLIKDIERNGNTGIGKPEQLRYDFSGWWSRHIDDTHRLIYRIEDNKIKISHCRTHYGNK